MFHKQVHQLETILEMSHVLTMPYHDLYTFASHLHHIHVFSLTETHSFKLNCNLFKHDVICVHNYLENKVPGVLNVFLINFHKVWVAVL